MRRVLKLCSKHMFLCFRYHYLCLTMLEAVQSIQMLHLKPSTETSTWEYKCLIPFYIWIRIICQCKKSLYFKFFIKNYTQISFSSKNCIGEIVFFIKRKTSNRNLIILNHQKIQNLLSVYFEHFIFQIVCVLYTVVKVFTSIYLKYRKEHLNIFILYHQH